MKFLNKYSPLITTFLTFLIAIFAYMTIHTYESIWKNETLLPISKTLRVVDSRIKDCIMKFEPNLYLNYNEYNIKNTGYDCINNEIKEEFYSSVNNLKPFLKGMSELDFKSVELSLGEESRSCIYALEKDEDKINKKYQTTKTFYDDKKSLCFLLIEESVSNLSFYFNKLIKFNNKQSSSENIDDEYSKVKSDYKDAKRFYEKTYSFLQMIINQNITNF